MDLELLKSKFRHRAEADVKDINLAIKAVPFLVKEVIRLEEELDTKNKLIERLKKKIKKQPPLIHKGEKDSFNWIIKVNEETNTILIQFNGVPNKSGAKICSNAVLTLSENLEPGFSVISDMRKLDTSAINQRMLFYFRKVHYLFLRNNVKYIIRVVPEHFKEIDGLMDIPSDQKKHLKMFSVTSIDEAKNIIRNLGKHLRK
ncbi:MAG: hypothetical protein H6681_00470 [Desulfobacteraceae bacterium]|nr:hypothetical protein [Desulfobacteraceae bacterium]